MLGLWSNESRTDHANDPSSQNRHASSVHPLRFVAFIRSVERAFAISLSLSTCSGCSLKRLFCDSLSLRFDSSDMWEPLRPLILEYSPIFSLSVGSFSNRSFWASDILALASSDITFPLLDSDMRRFVSSDTVLVWFDLMMA